MRSLGWFLFYGNRQCVDTTLCPAYATCSNATGGHLCACKKGFRPSHGQGQFKGPGVECIDVDECFQSPPRCGPNSLCENLPGRYRCSCLPGFSSPTGDAWTPARAGPFACTDTNECLQGGVCPEHSECTNSLGGYSCSCRVGFVANNSVCEDIDECLHTCFTNATCTNTLGSYVCTCHPGFALTMEPVASTGHKEECTDIDECLQDPLPCGSNSVCTNSQGDYSCGCKAGFRPHPEGSREQGNFSCKRVPFKCQEDVIPDNEKVQLCQQARAMESRYTAFCELMNATFRALEGACENKTAPVSLKSTVEDLASVLAQSSTWSNFTKEERSALATVLMETVESSTLAHLLTSSENTSQTIRTESFDLSSKVIGDECLDEEATFDLDARGDKMEIGCGTIRESESEGAAGVAFVSFSGLQSVLNESFFRGPEAEPGRKLRLSSHVVGGIMTGQRKDGFSRPIVYTLENIQPKLSSEQALCVAWRPDVAGGVWAPSGCDVLEASENRTICSCRQLSSLAVLMASQEQTVELPLQVISRVGLVLSLICLALAIATFVLCRALRSHSTTVRLHLCVCLFLAKTLFLAGVDQTHHQMGCAVLAGLLHFLFLACFCWMLAEALLLFLMVQNLSVLNSLCSSRLNMSRLCVLGYGLPVLVVAVSAGIHPQGYGTRNRCWLNTEAGFIWSFMGPVCVIIVINSVLLTWTLWTLRQTLSNVNIEVSKLKDNRLLTFKALAQMFILGCSWVLGIFQIGPIASFMAYLFTIINSLQGVFIFLIHCLLNRQVRDEYRRCFKRKAQRDSQPQTSGIVLSSLPSMSKSG